MEAQAERMGRGRVKTAVFAAVADGPLIGRRPSGGFYATRLYHDLRQVAGLVYNVDDAFTAGKTRSVYTVTFGSDPPNVTKAAWVKKSASRLKMLSGPRQRSSRPTGMAQRRTNKAMIRSARPQEGCTVSATSTAVGLPPCAAGWKTSGHQL